MRINAYRINGINYVEGTQKVNGIGVITCGCSEVIKPFYVYVPVCHLEWLKSLKHSCVMHIENEYKDSAKSMIFAHIPSKLVKICGFPYSVQEWMDEAGVNFTEKITENDIWMPNKMRILRKNGEKMPRNAKMYRAYYITSDTEGNKVIRYQEVEHPNQVLKCPKWKNAEKVHICANF